MSLSSGPESRSGPLFYLFLTTNNNDNTIEKAKMEPINDIWKGNFWFRIAPSFLWRLNQLPTTEYKLYMTLLGLSNQKNISPASRTYITIAKKETVMKNSGISRATYHRSLAKLSDLVKTQPGHGKTCTRYEILAPATCNTECTLAQVLKLTTGAQVDNLRGAQVDNLRGAQVDNLYERSYTTEAQAAVGVEADGDFASTTILSTSFRPRRADGRKECENLEQKRKLLSEFSLYAPIQKKAESWNLDELEKLIEHARRTGKNPAAIVTTRIRNGTPLSDHEWNTVVQSKLKESQQQEKDSVRARVMALCANGGCKLRGQTVLRADDIGAYTTAGTVPWMMISGSDIEEVGHA